MLNYNDDQRNYFNPKGKNKFLKLLRKDEK